MTKRLFLFVLNTALFTGSSLIITYLFWIWVGNEYLFQDSPSGGDYFNALTYLNFFKNHIDLPPKVWLPFWNEGTPLVGGYPWLIFYLMVPLTKYFDVASSMEIFSILSLLVFLISSLLLFWQISRSWILAFAFSLIVINTRATYYQLTTGGFISSASSQWFLPIVLYFIYKFGESKRSKFLVLASIFSGLSILTHAPTSMLMVFAPGAASLLLFQKSSLVKKTKNLTVFMALSLLIGSMSVYTVFLQTVLGSGTGNCASPECWGIYPKHLEVWMNPLAWIVLTAVIALTVFLKTFKKSIKLSYWLPAFGAVSIFVIYSLLAYFKLINGLANVIFPTRTFWALNLLVLVLAASFYREISSRIRWLSRLVASMLALGVLTYIIVFPLKVHYEYTATSPLNIAQYIVPRYQSLDPSPLTPEWLNREETKWRIDLLDPGITQWWNFFASLPSVSGYSNHPLGVHRDWQYFLRSATRNPKVGNDQLIQNRSLFLIDAFGIKYFGNSIAPYRTALLKDQKFVVREASFRDLSWYEISENFTTPIIYPTNSPTLLFVGNPHGYESFIRAIAMTNLSSRSFIPIYGPQSIDGLRFEDLKRFDALVLSDFRGDEYSEIEKYIKMGGNIFIDTGGVGSFDLKTNKSLLPFPQFTQLNLRGPWQSNAATKSAILTGIDIDEFSPFEFEGGNWKVTLGKTLELKPWAKPLITKNDDVLVAYGQIGKGKVFWSGVNLFFHIASTDNFEEAEFLKNVLEQIVVRPRENQIKYGVLRNTPEKIRISVANVRGIFFKENYHRGWSAMVNGQKIPIWKAGLEFMYIPLNEVASDKLNITISFTGSFANWFLFYLTIISFLCSLLYILIPEPFRAIGKFVSALIHTQTGNMRSWWKKD